MAMTDQEILTGLGEIIDEVAGVPADQVTPDKTFVDDLDIDSLSMVEIAVAAQDKFGVEIPDDQLKDLKTVQDVIDYVRRSAYRPDRYRLTGAAPTPARGPAPGAASPRLEEHEHSGHRPDERRRHRARRDHAGGRRRRQRPGTRCWPGAAGSWQLTDDWAAELPARIAAWAAVDPATLIDRVQARRMDRCEQFALVAAREAWADAGSPEVDPRAARRRGVQRHRRRRLHPERLRHAEGEGLAAALAVHRARC